MIELKPIVLAYLVGQIQMYSLLESDADVKGRAYEEIVGSNLRGDRGGVFHASQRLHDGGRDA